MSNQQLRRVRYVLPAFLLVWLCVALDAARPDSWASPTTREYRSSNDKYAARVVPAWGEAPSIRQLRSDLPHKVDSVLKRGVAQRPEDRFQSASQFVDELAAALQLSRKRRGRWWQFWR